MPSGAIFLDKDGTLLVDVPYNADPALMRLAPGADQALARLGALDVPLVVVSNQSGIARGVLTERDMRTVERELARLFRRHGATLAAYYFCPHAPPLPGAAGPACTCRKPAPGMLRRAAQAHGIDLTASWMIGDILDDVEAGRRAGCSTILIDNGNETQWQPGPWRKPDYRVDGLADAARIVATALAGARRHAAGWQRDAVA